MTNIGDIMRLAPVIPVLVIEAGADAGAIARALVAGGLRVLEVTLRTPAALGAIAEMRKVEGAVVGAGTVLNPGQLEQSLAAGAEFIVSPGLTEPLGRAAIASGIPFLPGIATAGRPDARPRPRPLALQILPGRNVRGDIRAEGPCRPVRRGAFLSHRRNHPGQRPGLARARPGALRRRLVAGSEGTDGRRRNRKPRPSRRIASALTGTPGSLIGHCEERQFILSAAAGGVEGLAMTEALQPEAIRLCRLDKSVPLS